MEDDHYYVICCQFLIIFYDLISSNVSLIFTERDYYYAFLRQVSFIISVLLPPSMRSFIHSFIHSLSLYYVVTKLIDKGVVFLC
jgi:hypothetical protein